MWLKIPVPVVQARERSKSNGGLFYTFKNVEWHQILLSIYVLQRFLLFRIMTLKNPSGGVCKGLRTASWRVGTSAASDRDLYSCSLEFKLFGAWEYELEDSKPSYGDIVAPCGISWEYGALTAHFVGLQLVSCSSQSSRTLNPVIS